MFRGAYPPDIGGGALIFWIKKDVINHSVMIYGARNRIQSSMDNGFASIWGIFFVPHAKFRFGVSRAQQGQMRKRSKAGSVSLPAQFSGK